MYSACDSPVRPGRMIITGASIAQPGENQSSATSPPSFNFKTSLWVDEMFDDCELIMKLIELTFHT